MLANAPPPPQSQFVRVFLLNPRILIKLPHNIRYIFIAALLHSTWQDLMQGIVYCHRDGHSSLLGMPASSLTITLWFLQTTLIKKVSFSAVNNALPFTEEVAQENSLLILSLIRHHPQTSKLNSCCKIKHHLWGISKHTRCAWAGIISFMLFTVFTLVYVLLWPGYVTRHGLGYLVLTTPIWRIHSTSHVRVSTAPFLPRLVHLLAQMNSASSWQHSRLYAHTLVRGGEYQTFTGR